MNLRCCILIPMTLVCATALAQTDTHSTTYPTAQGDLTVHSGQPTPRNYGPPPAFAQLAHRGAGFISADDADAYPPLANDFIYADANRDGRISKAEYERWAQGH